MFVSAISITIAQYSLLHISLYVPHPPAATIGFDTFDHALIEGTTADVCLFSLAENLEVTVSIRLSAVNGTAVEGTYTYI